MNIFRLYIPDLGPNVFKSLGATDTTTVSDVKVNLVNKLVGLDTIAATDATKFSIFELKDGKEEKLDDTKSIMAIIKKWPKKSNPLLLFKGSDKGTVLQVLAHTEQPASIQNSQSASNNQLLDDDDEVPLPSIAVPSISRSNTLPSPTIASASCHNIALPHVATSPPKKLEPSPSPSGSTTISNNTDGVSGDQALLILNTFEAQWKGGGINSSKDILRALGGA